MGYIKHDCALAVMNDYDHDGMKAMSEFIESLGENYCRYVLGPADCVNGYVVYVFAPDGSKEGWEHSNDCNLLRERFIEIANGAQYSDVFSLHFGGDDGWTRLKVWDNGEFRGELAKDLDEELELGA